MLGGGGRARPGARRFAERPTSASPRPVPNGAFLVDLVCHPRHYRVADEESDGAGRCAGFGWTSVNVAACLAPAGLAEASRDVVAFRVGAFTVSVRDCSLASNVALPL